MAQLTGSMVAFPGGATSNPIGLTSPNGQAPALGQRGRDQAGNEYIFCDLTAQVYGGVCVAISNDGLWTAAPFTNGPKGAVGVCAAQGTSDQGIWVQVYGTTTVQIASGDSAATSAMFAIAASSVSTPATGVDFTASGGATSSAVHRIFGMWITGDVTTATTSATSSVGVFAPVFLNYPYGLGCTTDFSST